MHTGMKMGTLSLEDNILLAPMAGVTDLPFRLMARRFGAGLCFTEMVSANGLVRETRRSYEYLDSSPEDHPLGVQIFGADPSVMAAAAAIVTEHGADLVDINAGCPVKKVIKTGAGAALMRDPARLAAVVGQVRAATHLPVTVKIRSGWRPGEINAVAIARLARDHGADAVTVHPRTARQGFGGTADWKLIGLVKEVVDIPVIGSGDIRRPADARAMLERTGCDGVMVGRGALGNPWIFRDIKTTFSDGAVPPPPSPLEREEAIRRHLAMHIRHYGEPVGIRAFRKHLSWYTKGLRGGNIFRKTAVSAESMDELMEMTDIFLHSLWDGGPGTGQGGSIVGERE